MHFIGFFDKFISKVGMTNGNYLFCPFPSRSSFEIYQSIFRNQVLRISSRSSNYTAFRNTRFDPAFKRTVFCWNSGRTANKTLTAFRFISTEYKVKLSARTAYMTGPACFGSYLSEQVNFNGIIYGNKII